MGRAMDRRHRHGHCKQYAKPVEYSAWINMRQRCSRDSGPDYPNYKGRGISVCPEWESFARFLSDMGPRPSPSHSIERVNNDLGYSKENCVWATKQVQSKNQRIRRDSTTGIKGVCLLKTGFFTAYGNGKYLGYHGQDFFEACCVRKSWEATRKETT